MKALTVTEANKLSEAIFLVRNAVNDLGKSHTILESMTLTQPRDMGTYLLEYKARDLVNQVCEFTRALNEVLNTGLAVKAKQLEKANK